MYKIEGNIEKIFELDEEKTKDNFQEYIVDNFFNYQDDEPMFLDIILSQEKEQVKNLSVFAKLLDILEIDSDDVKEMSEYNSFKRYMDNLCEQICKEYRKWLFKIGINTVKYDILLITEDIDGSQNICIYLKKRLT